MQVQGQIARRSDPNPELPTGQVELIPSKVAVLNTVPAKLPLLPADASLPKEETRLRNRVLDLRHAVCTSAVCMPACPSDRVNWRCSALSACAV